MWSGHGIAFGSHTATHPRLAWIDDGRLADELGRSRRSLERALGSVPTAIAYPFGGADARVTAAARRSGYTVGFALGGRWTGDALRVPRAAVHCWSPDLPIVGPLGQVERWVSTLASRCSIGTSILQHLTRHA
jgi:peptidoglycan/xylan/chitin deacetylase (PgdA/CDA1 family)